MNKADIRTRAGRGSIVVEDQDLFSDIEQDRFVTKALAEKRFIFTPFPQSLEQNYVIESEPRKSRAISETLFLSSLLLIFYGGFSLVLGANMLQMQLLIPGLFACAVGLVLQKTSFLHLFMQVYLVLLAVALGCSTFLLADQMAKSTTLIESITYGQANGYELLTLGFAVYAVCIMTMASRAPMELPTLAFVLLAAGLSWMSVGMLTLEFLFTAMAIASVAFWVWSEDNHRRFYLQRCATTSARNSAPKETERARQLVVLDNQTGLANNISFMRFFANEWKRAFRARQSVSLIMIRLGVPIEKLTEHGQLDRVLTELQRYSRRPGDLVGKIDTNCFGVLLSNTDIANSRRLAESLLGHMHGLDLGKDGILKVYMGVASTLPMPSMSHEDLMNKAMEALDSAQKDSPAHKTTEPKGK